MRICKVLTVWLVGIGLLISAPATWAATEAEVAAQSQRALTKDEIRIKEADCTMPTSGETLNGVPSGIHAVRVEISQQRFLALFMFDGTITGKKKDVTRLYPALPLGGIGARDMCDVAQVGIIPSDLSTSKQILVAFRLRPGLNLAKDYPNSTPHIRQNRQLLTMPTSDFALITFTDAKQVGEIIAAMANWDRVVPRAYYYLSHKKLYVPLRK